MYHETRWAQEAHPQWQRLIPAPVEEMQFHFVNKRG
jgi:hypothetical protein